MTTNQPSLLDGDTPAGWTDQLQGLLDQTIALIRRNSTGEQHLTDVELESALDLVRTISDELRIINSPDGVPF